MSSSKIKKNIKRKGSFERELLWKLPSLYSYIYGLCPPAAKKLIPRIKDKKTEEELLILLDNMAGNLGGGVSIVDTIRSLVPRIKAPLKNELSVFLILQKEHGTITAIEKSTSRSTNLFVKIMWTILLTYYRNGGAVVENIKRLHHGLYTRINIKSRLNAQLMQNKVQIIAGVVLPYVLFLVLSLLYPELMSEVPHSSIGIGIILFSLVLHGIGVFFFIRITRFDTASDLNSAMLFEYICFSIKNGIPVLSAINNVKDFGIVEEELLGAVKRSSTTAELIEQLGTPLKQNNLDLLAMLKRSHNLGTQISEELSFRSKDIMEKLEQRALRFQQLIAVKALIPMLFCIFPATYLMILTPIIVEISNSQI